MLTCNKIIAYLTRQSAVAYLASVSEHGVGRFGKLLPADHFQDELFFGVGRKWITRERVEST